MKQKIGLIELTTFHEECLYTQAVFLKDSGYETHLFIHPKLKVQIADYKNLFKKITFVETTSKTFFPKRMIRFLKLYLNIRKGSFHRIIFNTASSKKEIIGLSYLLKKKIKCLGIIHDQKKINHSFSQRLISNTIKNYFVLNDYMLHSANIENKTLHFESFYPIFFPEFEKINLHKPKNEVWITIPGEFDFNRRNYMTVAKSLTQNTKIKIVILGKKNNENEASMNFIRYLKESNLEKKFIFFDNFIPNNLFHSYLSVSNYIMTPLSIKKNNYLKYKITGAFNLAFAYKKPLICPEELCSVPDLKAHSLFYSDEASLSKLLMEISQGQLKFNINYKEEKWSFKHQQKNYLKLLEA